MSGAPQPIVPGHRPASPQPNVPQGQQRAEALAPAPRIDMAQLGGDVRQELRARLGDPFFRCMGVVLIAVGAVLGKLFVLDVLAAARHQAELTIYEKPVLLAGMLPCFGLLMLLFGKKIEPYLKIDRRNLSARQVLVIVLALAPGMALMFWLKSKLAELGYEH